MFEITADFDRLERALTDLAQRQLPFAMATALNETAKEVLADVRKEMSENFDNPTPWTLNAFFVQRASKRKLVARVRRKIPQRGRHYLETQEEGGARPQTGFEKLVASRMKYGGIIRTITPAKGARLNKYGNMSPGQRNKILSAVKAQRDSSANTTKESRQKHKRRAGYFVPRPGSKLSPGIYRRSPGGKKITKVMHFSDDAANYQARFDFDGVSQAMASRKFPQNFARAMKRAIATAR